MRGVNICKVREVRYHRSIRQILLQGIRIHGHDSESIIAECDRGTIKQMYAITILPTCPSAYRYVP